MDGEEKKQEGETAEIGEKVGIPTRKADSIEPFARRGSSTCDVNSSTAVRAAIGVAQARRTKKHTRTRDKCAAQQ